MKFVSYSDWSLVPECANALFAQAGKESVFCSREWFECLTSHALEAGHTMMLACVLNGDRMMAILPLMEYAGVNTLYALRHGFTPHFSLLLAEDDQEPVLACLARGIGQLPVSAVLLEPVFKDDSRMAGLAKHLKIAGFSIEYRFRDYNWVYPLRGQRYQEYMSGRPAVLCNTISRKMRKLEREHGFEIRLFAGKDVPGRMADYLVVYNASWKQNEISNAVFQERFVEAFSRAGWSRLAILYIKGHPVAAQLWFVHHGNASIFRLAYDKSWRHYSTGSILTRFLMEYVIDTDKVDKIDFLTGNDAYKTDWMSERRESFQLSCIRSRRTESWLEKMAASIRKILKTK